MSFLEQMYTSTAQATEELFEEINVDLMEKIADLITALDSKSLRNRLENINTEKAIVQS